MKAIRFLIWISLVSTAFGQDFPRSGLDPGRIADELYALQGDDLNYEELYENLLQLLSHPIDINKANGEELRFLKLLSEDQIESFLRYREENGKLISIYELQAVPRFDPETILKLAPLVTVADPETTLDATFWSRVKKEGDNYFITRYERTVQSRHGFNNDVDSIHRFRGSPDKLYFRFRCSRSGDYSVGFTAEKDPGEKIEWNSKLKYYGFDYLSFHIQVQNKGRLKNLVVGDFQTQFAQGIMLGGGFGTGKGSESVLAVRRSNVGLMPYTSVNEAGSLSGVAATVELSAKTYITGFYSRAKRDASLDEDTLRGNVISSFQTSGLHRNAAELSKRKLIADQNAALVVQYNNGQLDAGLMYNVLNFDLDLVRSPTPYNQFTFEGRMQQNLGAFVNYTFLNAAFFGEFSKSLNGGSAWTTGMLLGLSPSLDMALSYRSFARNYHSFYSSAFGENSATQNEKGFYWGWKYRVNHKIALSAYVDFFKFPWLRHRGYSPSHGHEWLLRLTYQPTRKVMMFVQAREEMKERNTGESAITYSTAQGRKHNYWVGVEYGLRQKLRMKTRAQFSTYRFNGHTSRGMAVLQDISAEIGKLQITARYAVTDTDDYDNRQYVYENDVWLAYSMPAYSGVSIRKMLLLEYKISRYISIWMRFASTRFPNEKKTGSGLDAIDTNIKNDIKFQLRISF